MRLQPPAAKKLLAHQREVNPRDEQQWDEPVIEQGSERNLNDGSDGPQDTQLTQAHKTSRHGPVGTISGVLVEVLELIGEPQVEEGEKLTKQRDGDDLPRGETINSAKKRGKANGAEAKSEDQRPVRENGKSLPLINPPTGDSLFSPGHANSSAERVSRVRG
jgi:hypothetical protein